ncbi:MAG: 2-phospho-L-lactate guanylyltransferase [Nitriliruptoraceae bacterium]
MILPLRNPSEGKTRLAPVLDPHLRRALVEAMFTDVVRAVTRGPVGDVVVAAQGPEACALARSQGLDAIEDPTSRGGLVEAVAGATASVAHRDVAVIAADLPGLTPIDVQALLRPDAEVVIAPTRRGGTGGLLRRPGGCLTADYGPRSGDLNAAAARDAGLRVATVHVNGLHDDVDVVDDLVALDAATVGLATSVLLDAIREQVSAWDERPRHGDGHGPPATWRTR